MEVLRRIRGERGLSQRELAARAGLSFRGYQLLEQAGHDSRLSSLERVAVALGCPAEGPRVALGEFLCLPRDSIRMACYRILASGTDSWRIHLFDFVDAFRRRPVPELVREPPVRLESARVDALVAGTVEALCAEAGLPPPPWCEAVRPLPDPWFVSGVENLKASALAESPFPFRRRNVFVLANFLSRA